MKSQVVHGLKIWPVYFETVRNGTKTFEYRKNDRDFQVGDILHLQEWENTIREYTGRELRMEVTYVLEVKDEMCILGIRKEEDASVGELLRELVEAWESSVERWWQNHDSIPTAFVKLAVAIEKAQRIMRGEMGKEDKARTVKEARITVRFGSMVFLDIDLPTYLSFLTRLLHGEGDQKVKLVGVEHPEVELTLDGEKIKVEWPYGTEEGEANDGDDAP